MIPHNVTSSRAKAALLGLALMPATASAQARAPYLDPARAHEACMAMLPGRETAMAPQRYVICAPPPGDAGDPAAWRAQPVVAAGSGR